MQTRCEELQGDLDACLDTLETDRAALTESQSTINQLQVHMLCFPAMAHGFELCEAAKVAGHITPPPAG